MKIYTKTGDEGETGLFGGERVKKYSRRINAYGTIDELNSFIGMAVIESGSDEVKKVLLDIQNKLFVVGSDLATPQTEKNEKLKIMRIPESYIYETEKLIDEFDSRLETLKNFILPGGSKGAALLHVCRTISRRAEREVANLQESEMVNKNILVYLNRIADLFFVLSRFENKSSEIPDTKWVP